MFSSGSDWRTQCWFMILLVHLFGCFFACLCHCLQMVLHSQHLYTFFILCVWSRYGLFSYHSFGLATRSPEYGTVKFFCFNPFLGAYIMLLRLLFRNHALLAVVIALTSEAFFITKWLCDLEGGPSGYCTGQHIIKFGCGIGTISTLFCDGCTYSCGWNCGGTTLLKWGHPCWAPIGFSSSIDTELPP
jgi:hypothetical protein